MAYYPAFESTDPRPMLRRGAYFSGISYVQLPPAPDTSGPTVVFTNSVSVSIWIRMQELVYQKIYEKMSMTDGIQTLSFQLTLSGSILIEANSLFQLTPQSVFILPAPTVPLDQWTFVAFSFSYDSGLGETLTKVFFNGVQVDTNLFTFTWSDIYETSAHILGGGYGVNYFKGFIWRFTIYPYVRTFETDIASAGCPAGLSYCLSSASQVQTYTGENCLLSCPIGCLRSSDCSLCGDVLCEVCASFEACFRCIPNAAVVAGTCTCAQGYFYVASSNTCNLCEPTCKECTSQASRCTVCFSSAFVDSAGKCTCGDGFYPNPTSAQCSACNEECRICTSAAVCVSCWNNAELKISTCVCLSGYFGMANNCLNCPSFCSKCSGAVCERCFPGYFLNENSCSLGCPSVYTEDQVNWVCLPIPNPYKGVEVTAGVDDSNNITLRFSQPVKPKLTLLDLDLSLSDADFNHYNFSANMTEVQTNQTFAIALQIQATYLPASNVLSISFIHPEQFMDEFGNHLLRVQLSVQLLPTGVSELPEVYQANESQVAYSATTVIFAAGAALSVITMDPTIAFTIINNVQSITYFPLSTVQLPKELKSRMVSMNLQSYFSNPLTPSVDAEKELKLTAPYFALNYGFSDATFIKNARFILFTFALNIGLLPVFWLLSRISIPRVTKFFRERLGGYRWRNLIMHWVETYLDLTIACFLRLRVVIFKADVLCLSYSGIRFHSRLCGFSAMLQPASSLHLPHHKALPSHFPAELRLSPFLEVPLLRLPK